MDIGVWGDKIYNRQTDSIYFKLFQAADKRAILFANGQEQHLCHFPPVSSIMLPMLKNIILKQYGFVKFLAKGFFTSLLGIIENISHSLIFQTA